MAKLLAPFLALTLLVGCAGLDEYLAQPLDTGDTSDSPTTIGDSSANTVDSISEPTTNMVSMITTALTGNPVLGGTAAALAAGLLALGSQRLRRKKQGDGAPPATS